MSHPEHRRARIDWSRSGWVVRIGGLAVVLAAGLLACGSDTKSATDTLPPIATTTTTTTMPPTTTTIPDFYIIQPGDTLFSIATMFGLDTDVLAAYNNIVNKEHIESGQKLKIPPAGTQLATTVPETIAVTLTPTVPPPTTIP
jgi:LysM repeat protein